MRRSAAMAAVLALGGCGVMPASGPGAAGEVEAGWRAPGPFEPMVLRVFPLTRVERDEAGAARLVLHVELKDQWGDTVKGVGALTVQMQRPDGSGRGEARWDVAMWGDEDNARHYDPSSRTYRFVLGDVPAWVSEETGTVRVTAQLRTPKSDGSMKRLWDSVEVTP